MQQAVVLTLRTEAQRVDRIGDAVAAINDIAGQKALEAAIEIGRYLLDHFYGGDLGAFHSKGRKNVTLRQIASHPDMPFSATYLYSAVAVAEQFRQLPNTCAKGLSFSHHRKLLSVSCLERKRHLAARAVNERWSVRTLAERIGSTKRRSAKFTNPNTPLVSQCMDELDRVIDMLDEADRVDLQRALGGVRDDQAFEMVENALGKALQVVHSLRRLRAQARRRYG